MTRRRSVLVAVVAGLGIGTALHAADFELEVPHTDVAVAPGSSVDVPVTFRNNTASPTPALLLSVNTAPGFEYESLSQPDCSPFEPAGDSILVADIAAIPANSERTCTIHIGRDAGANSHSTFLHVDSQGVPSIYEYLMLRIGSFGELTLSGTASNDVVSPDIVRRTIRLDSVNDSSTAASPLVSLGQPCDIEASDAPDACQIIPGACPAPGPASVAVLPAVAPGSTSSCTVSLATPTDSEETFSAQVIGMTDASGLFAYDISDANSNITLSLPIPSVPTNQYGLSGSWVNPQAPAQGFVLNMQPDFNGPGRALLFAGWFTYAPFANQGQRWYTIQADTGGGLDQLPIYLTDGGLFDSPMPTTTVAVGTANLRFFDCRYGKLDYSFFDNGSLQQGTIPLTRLLNNVSCSANGDASRTARSYSMTGIWADPGNSGQGLVLEVDTIQHALFGAWYTFASDTAHVGERRWYTVQASIDDDAIQTGDVAIYTSSGGTLNGDHPATTVQVGSGTLVRHDCNSATMTYHFTSGENAGRNGTLDLGRLGHAPPQCE